MNGRKDDEQSHSSSESDLERGQTFHRRLALIRDPKESATSFAKRAGLSQSGYHRIEKGGEPGLRSLIAIADAAGVRVEWLATGEGPMRHTAESETPATPPVRAAARSSDTAFDEELHALVVDGIDAVYKEEGARLPPRDLGRLAARIHGDLVAAYDDPDDRKVALKLALQSLRRDLRSAPTADGQSKRQA